MRLKAKAAFFYADDRMVVSTETGWIQTKFDTLTGLFNRVGLKKNVTKTVGMVCHPCQAAGVQADKAYTRWMIGVRKSYKEQHRQRVNCLECRKDLARGSLAAHRQTQYGVVKGGLGKEGNGEGGGNDPRTYRMSFTAKAGKRPCPVEGCSVRAATRTAMRMNFWHQHVRNTVVIMEKGTPPTHYDLCATCWCRRNPSMGCTSTQRSARKRRIVSDVGWRRRKKWK